MSNLIKTKRNLLGPSVSIPEDIKNELASLNAARKKHQDYKKGIETIFQLEPARNFSITNESMYYMAGFIEGEASLNVSAKKTKDSTFGFCIDPEFSITQHMDGIENLYLALCIFQTGRIRYKSGSNATLVFTIQNMQSLTEKVIPFLKKYSLAFASANKQKRIELFIKLVDLFHAKVHCNLDGFRYEILPIWDALRVQKGTIK
uniref:Putative LAGLIDADG homing endonuclease n=1 Tax=Carteria sp. SAG 8-5 TaxID=1756294 RepID=A0A0S2LPR7_9CHLO|nr:putative LAGLIDADG homing endonuclease [Carteria sp. SAG 8-5]ALO63401.1 putative LAGLIDADG homing endonuclease [Carteria sp. SAG 8-5]